MTEDIDVADATDIRRILLDLQLKLTIITTNYIFSQITDEREFLKVANLSSRIFSLLSETDVICGKLISNWAKLEYASLIDSAEFFLNELNFYSKQLNPGSSSYEELEKESVTIGMLIYVPKMIATSEGSDVPF